MLIIYKITTLLKTRVFYPFHAWTSIKACTHKRDVIGKSVLCWTLTPKIRVRDLTYTQKFLPVCHHDIAVVHYPVSLYVVSQSSYPACT